MAEYIERERAEIIFRDARLALKPEGCKDWNEYITRDMMLMNAEQAIHIIPAADVAPVVRCQECYAYRKDKELAKAAYLDGEMYCALLRCEMPQDGFCYYGKRNCGAKMEDEDEQGSV